MFWFACTTSSMEVKSSDPRVDEFSMLAAALG